VIFYPKVWQGQVESFLPQEHGVGLPCIGSILALSLCALISVLSIMVDMLVARTFCVYNTCVCVCVCVFVCTCVNHTCIYTSINILCDSEAFVICFKLPLDDPH
jgi:hypothetical protein